MLETSLVTDEIKDAFNNQGFAVIPDVLGEHELEEYRQLFDELVVEEDEKIDREGQNERTITIEGKRYFIGFPHQRKAALKKQLFSDTMVDITTSLIGDTVYVYWDQCVIKFKDEESSFAWHQDSGYGPTRRPHTPYLTCWVALDDVNEDNGTVYMLPYDKAGTKDIIDHVWDEEKKAMVGYWGDEPGVPVVMKAGSIAVFSSVTFHRSSANVSGAPRRVYYTAYSTEEMFMQDGETTYGLNIPFAKNGVKVPELP